MTRLVLTALASTVLLAGPDFAKPGPDAASQPPAFENGSSTLVVDCPGRKHVNA